MKIIDQVKALQYFCIKSTAMRTVKEILQQKGPQFNVISPDKTVLEAISVMKCENISYLIVKENDEYLGIISERDYAHKVILVNKHSDSIKVREIMTTDIPVVALTDAAEHCMKLMNVSKSRYLPVFEERIFQGIITIHDLMREAIAENEKLGAVSSEQHEKLLRDYWI